MIEHDGEVVGSVDVRDVGEHTGQLSWALYAGHRGRGYATRAVRLLSDYALRRASATTRVEAKVEPGNTRGIRVATRSGLRREGVRRVDPGSGDRPETTEYVSSPGSPTTRPSTEPESFRALLNSFLPRKRAIAQMLVRDPDGRVLLCRLTYKNDWDLPGGVVEVGESPQDAVSREVEEELGLDRGRRPPAAHRLAAAVERLGRRALPGLRRRRPRRRRSSTTRCCQAREIRSARFCTLDEVRAHCADFTARRIEAALATSTVGGTAYTESGRPTPA